MSSKSPSSLPFSPGAGAERGAQASLPPLVEVIIEVGVLQEATKAHVACKGVVDGRMAHSA